MNLKDLIRKNFPSRDNHRPTKLCPHRYCRGIHGLVTLCGLPLIAFILFHASIWFLVFMLLLGFIVTGAERTVWKKSRVDLAVEEHAARHTTGKTTVLVVRRGWARAALVCDLIVLAAVVHSVASLTEVDMSVPAGGDADLLALAFVVGFFAFSALAHRKATELAKPLRVPVRVPGHGSA
ncbi:hypothetical protein [Streptomyces sp. NPDC007074]|uniref:hypothetical protein n=1 Tax=Streptomyces sp. NPDC007074 TaxID=3156764 RepID=UPI0033C13386